MSREDIILAVIMGCMLWALPVLWVIIGYI